MRTIALSFLAHTFITVSLLAAPPEQALNGTLQSHGFTGPVSKQTVRYTVYLPKGYEESDERLPVVYFLHGLGQARTKGVAARYAENAALFYDRAIAEGDIVPLIQVIPHSGGANMWADTKDGSSMAETQVIRELIPHVDKKYRTIASREGRIVDGFSMGGYGSALYGAKFPELFCGAIVGDGALHTWKTLSESRRTIAEGAFSIDEQYFNRYSPHAQVAANAEKLRRHKMKFLILVGRLKEYNSSFKQALDKSDVAYQYIETPHGHELLKVRQFCSEAMLSYVNERFAR